MKNSNSPGCPLLLRFFVMEGVYVSVVVTQFIEGGRMGSFCHFLNTCLHNVWVVLWEAEKNRIRVDP